MNKNYGRSNKMAIVKEIIKTLQKYNPDDVIHINWISKGDVKDIIRDQELTDENDELITEEVINSLVDNDFMLDFNSQLDDDDYVWEKFSESVNDIARELSIDKLEGNKKIDNEIDNEQELWD